MNREPNDMDRTRRQAPGIHPDADRGPGRSPDAADPGDAELQEAFDALRSHVNRSSAAPDFQAMMDRAKQATREVGGDPAAPNAAGAAPAPVDLARYRRTRRLAGWLSLAAAATVAALFWANAPSAADREFEHLVSAYTEELEGGALRSPTSALLRTPGLDLGAVPSFGSALRGLDRTTQPETPGSGGRDS